MIPNNFDVAIAKEISEGKRKGSIKTRDGMPVRILAWNAKGRFPIVALVDLDDVEYPRSYTADGRGDLRPNVATRYDLEIVEGGVE